MAREMRGLKSARQRAWPAVICLFAALALAGCTPTSVPDKGVGAGLEAGSLRWEPRRLAGATPGLVGWRAPADGAPGALVSLSPDGPGSVIWQAPPVGETYLQPIEVDPHGLRLIAEAYSTVTGVGVCSQTLLFRTDGTVVEVEVPAGFDGVVDVAFIGAEVLAVAYRATPDTFETALGLVSDAGTWVAVTIEGDLPEHHFVEACLVLPGTDTVALVLKVSGGDGDRDDDAIVLARLSGARLDVFTPPLFDDSLPGAQPLWDADGVVYPRLWNQVDGETAPVLVRAEWAAGQWVESEVLPSTALLLGPEMGEVVAQDASGTYWLRATDDQHGEVGNLLRLPYGARSPEPTGVDLSGITWFAWTEGER